MARKHRPKLQKYDYLNPKIPLTIRVPPQLDDEISDLAEKEDRSVSNLACELLRGGLAAYRDLIERELGPPSGAAS